MGDLKWYHYAGAGLLAWYLWKQKEDMDALAANLAATQAAGLDREASAAAAVDAEHRAAVAARAEVAKRDAALAAQSEITAQTVGAVTGTVRAILPPITNAPPRLVVNAPAAVENERTLSLTANNGDTRIVPKEGSLSIERDTTYGATPTVLTEQQAMTAPTKKTSLVVSADLDELRNLRTV
jgi:hypothetical protein